MTEEEIGSQEANQEIRSIVNDEFPGFTLDDNAFPAQVRRTISDHIGAINETTKNRILGRLRMAATCGQEMSARDFAYNVQVQEAIGAIIDAAR